MIDRRYLYVPHACEVCGGPGKTEYSNTTVKTVRMYKRKFYGAKLRHVDPEVCERNLKSRDTEFKT